MPRLLTGLVDDAAVFPPGSAALPDAVRAHRAHRTAWYADLVGPLLVPASALPALAGLLDDTPIEVGVIGDLPIDQLDRALAEADRRIVVRQVEAAVGKRGEDPAPGLAALLARADGIDRYAEIPLTFGLMAALDTLATARQAGQPVAAKFRTGGLAAELFPRPAELAAVICACRDRDLPFKLTAGLHHAVRHLDPETGFTHHGFGNVLAAVLVAADGETVDTVAARLASTDPLPVAERVRADLAGDRPWWVGFGSCSVSEPLTDLIRLGLVNGGYQQ
ncbi:hypothetical protein GCM10012279_56630 [Micromonospora yangpuensis]|uniref:Uncharacterized protein n=1 Tax=Micromonospora yangpuensis TaxID=683228 RepID=A0A1C6VFE5_9ACTN|nr:hypothetical protein GCM10012279_56630 [Micromonospora yangpuensis]SCL64764.1 hypothetical protein GA0070617_5559 [Micromonospora yangpuensis]